MIENKILDDFARRVMLQIESTGRKILGFKWHIIYSPTIVDYRSVGPGQGMSGRVWIRYDKNYPGFASDSFDLTGTYTGTGGAGAYSGPWKDISVYAYYAARLKLNINIPKTECFSWDYRFIFRHPKVNLIELETLIKETDMFEKLAGNTLASPLKHCFEFKDDATEESDLEFILRVKDMAGDRIEKLRGLEREYY